MERITKLIGGPMSEIFARAMSNIDIDHTDDKVVDIAPDGVWVKLDGENYYLGTASYMTANNFEVYTNSDVIDLDGCEVKPNATLFLADSSYVVMTFSLRYELNRSFETVLRCCTVNPAKDMGLKNGEGTLTVGGTADVAVFKKHEKEVVFGDREDGDPDQRTITGHVIYEPVVTVKSGSIVYRNIMY